MSLENHLFDRKKLDALNDAKELVKDCVAFANAEGGILHIGVADNEILPPPEQKIAETKIVELSKKIDGNTINVSVLPTKITAENGGEFIEASLLRKLDFKGKTSLKGIESHRLRELILRDLEIYHEVGLNEIHQRIGLEIPLRKIKYELKKLVEEGEIDTKGKQRWLKYLWTKTL